MQVQFLWEHKNVIRIICLFLLAMDNTGLSQNWDRTLGTLFTRPSCDIVHFSARTMEGTQTPLGRHFHCGCVHAVLTETGNFSVSGPALAHTSRTDCLLHDQR